MPAETETNLTTAGAGAFVDGPRLLADIGVTNAHFALETAPGRFEAIEVLQCAEHAGIAEVIRAYLGKRGGSRLRHAAIGSANPVDGDLVRMTNRDWRFSIEATRRELDLDTLLVVNDFTALAMALPYLGDAGRRQMGGGKPQADGVMGLIGPGTGLGVSGLIPAEDRWITLGSEGGHASYSPCDERELYILQYAWREFPHISAERLFSAPGMELVYRALAARASRPAENVPMPEIVKRALAGTCPVCVETVDCFCAMAGTVASNVALMLGAVGGIYIGGGMVRHLGELFARSSFRQRFEAKGRMSDYLAQIPTYLITAEHPAFVGVSAILAEHLRGKEGSSPLLDKIRQALDDLSPAEKRVASLILDRPRTALNDPIADIAHKADVSQPTVIRFCRSLGCEGLSDFKLKLASGLTGTIPVRHSQVRLEDSAADLSAKVLDNTVSAILKFRDSVNGESVARAIELLRKARRIEFYGVGNSSVVALDGQHKFFRFRIPTIAYSDPRLQALSAETLSKGDIVVAVSTSGRIPDLLHAVDLALKAGAAVIAIAPSNSPLAKKATLTLAVDHTEDSATFISMISRILHLLVVDTLAVGVAMRHFDSRSEPRKGARAGVASGASGGKVEPALGTLISHAS